MTIAAAAASPVPRLTRTIQCPPPVSSANPRPDASGHCLEPFDTALWPVGFRIPKGLTLDVSDAGGVCHSLDIVCGRTPQSRTVLRSALAPSRGRLPAPLLTLITL